MVMIGPKRYRGSGIKSICWIYRTKGNKPSHGIRSIDCRLGPFEHFHLVNIVKQTDHAQTAQIHIIQNKPNRKIGRAFTKIMASLSYTPDLKISRTARSPSPVQIGYLICQYLEMVTASAFNVLLCQDGQTGCCPLKGFLR